LLRCSRRAVRLATRPGAPLGDIRDELTHDETEVVRGNEVKNAVADHPEREHCAE
jgi:hypothetical protein